MIEGNISRLGKEVGREEKAWYNEVKNKRKIPFVASFGGDCTVYGALPLLWHHPTSALPMLRHICNTQNQSGWKKIKICYFAMDVLYLESIGSQDGFRVFWHKDKLLLAVATEKGKVICFENSP